MPGVAQKPRPALFFRQRPLHNVTRDLRVRPHRGAVTEILDAMPPQQEPLGFEYGNRNGQTFGILHEESLCQLVISVFLFSLATTLFVIRYTGTMPEELDKSAFATDAGKIDRHNQAYRQGVELIEPHIRLVGRAVKFDARAEAALRSGIGHLMAALELCPDNWAAWWVRGKAEQALSDHEAAYSSFQHAYNINGQHADVTRELVLECLETGRTAEAVRAAEAISNRNPNDAGLLANLALAYLLDGQLEKAAHAVDAAIMLDRTDQISKHVKLRIEEVRAGRQRQPSRMSDLQG